MAFTRFFGQKIRAPEKTTPLFLLFFSKKSTSQKTPFFRVGRNFEDIKSKKGPKITDQSPRPQNEFGKTFGQKIWGRQKFWSGATCSRFYAFFSKNRFCGCQQKITFFVKTPPFVYLAFFSYFLLKGITEKLSQLLQL